jgi:hypothetical protein
VTAPPPGTPNDLTAQAALLQVVVRLTELVESLTAQLVALKREGFAPPLAAPDVDATPVLPDAVMIAIQQKSGGEGDPLYAHLRRYAEGRLRAGVEAQVVADEIERGADVDAVIGQTELDGGLRAAEPLEDEPDGTD